MTDHDLLRRYTAEGSEAAFAMLVERHVSLVYSVARRHVVSSQLAEEVSQSVFLELARQAKTIRPSASVVAWLHLVSRRKAIDVVRREARRHVREQQAAEIAAMNSSSPHWSEVEPLLDEAVESLDAPERAAILLRYFENKSLRVVGEVLGTSEDTAQKRVSRAVDRLRDYFLKRGIAISATGLVSDLSAHALYVAPTGLGSTIATHITTGAAAVGSTAAAMKFAEALAMTTLQKSAAWTALAVAAGAAFYQSAIIRVQGSALASARERHVSIEADMRALRAAEVATSNRLAAVEQQIDARLAQQYPAHGATDAVLARQIEEWRAQLNLLKSWLAERNELNIPELALLQDHEWFDAASTGKLETEAELRQAASQLRRRAENIVAGRLHRALNAYVTANGNRLPERPEDLAVFCDPPLDPAVFARYEMRQRGDLASLSKLDRLSVLIVKHPADVEYDAHWEIGLFGYGNTSAIGVNLNHARRAFAAANNGQTATSAAQLQPYLKWPVDLTVLQRAMNPVAAK